MPIPFDQGMNGLASYFAGSQAADEQAQRQAGLASIQLQNQREAQMLPLDIQAKQATLPGIVGQSQQQAAAGQLAQGTLSDAIATKMQNFKAQASEDQVKVLDSTAEKLQKAAVAVKAAGLPTMAVPEAMRKVLAQYGIDENNPFAKGILNMPPDQMLDNAEQIGKGIAMAKPTNITNTAQQEQAQKFKKDELTQTLASHEKIAGGNNATSIEVANINANARTSVASIRNELKKPMNMDQRITYLSSIPPEDRTLAENEQLDQLSKQRLAERAAGANGIPAAMLNLPNPQAAAQAASPFVNPPQAQPIPSAPPGMRQIGTSGGRPVYEDAQGNRYIK